MSSPHEQDAQNHSPAGDVSLTSMEQAASTMTVADGTSRTSVDEKHEHEDGSPEKPATTPVTSSDTKLDTERHIARQSALGTNSSINSARAKEETQAPIEDGQNPRGSATARQDGETNAKASNEESGPEITTIMDQFKSGPQTLHDEAVASPTNSNLPVFEYPPRSSSLEHRRASLEVGGRPPPALKRADTGTYPTQSHTSEKSSKSYASSTVSQPPLPEPDPEPDLPFDFHRFLEQLRHRSADPVAKFLKSFLHEFGKRPWMVHEQVKIVRDFLQFISGRMAQCEVWKTVSDAEFDNAQEGMEKLVMNRLYTQTFAPEIPATLPAKAKRPFTNSNGPVRKGQHLEDVERDDVLAQKIRIYHWVSEEHLDISPPKDAKGRKFLRLAQQELVKIQNYRAPRDKIICVLNCCKVLFGYLRSAQSDQSADDFIPLLIYTVLRASPEHLVSNVQYIQRFRNPDKLTGEAGYYMSSLLGAVHFIENLDRTSLTISDEDYEKNVEQSVAVIAERRSREEPRQGTNPLPFNEKSGLSRPEVTPRHSLEAEQVSPRRKSARNNSSTGEDASAAEESDENAAVAGLLRTIQKPLSTIGRIFSDDSSSAGQGPARTPQPGASPRMSPSLQNQTTNAHLNPTALPPGAAAQKARQNMTAEEAAARQASAESAEAQRAQRAEHQTVVETLAGMFPGLDRDVISDVVRMKDGKVGLAVDACLALSR